MGKTVGARRCQVWEQTNQQPRSSLWQTNIPTVPTVPILASWATSPTTRHAPSIQMAAVVQTKTADNKWFVTEEQELNGIEFEDDYHSLRWCDTAWTLQIHYRNNEKERTSKKRTKHKFIGALWQVVAMGAWRKIEKKNGRDQLPFILSMSFDARACDFPAVGEKISSIFDFRISNYNKCQLFFFLVCVRRNICSRSHKKIHLPLWTRSEMLLCIVSMSRRMQMYSLARFVRALGSDCTCEWRNHIKKKESDRHNGANDIFIDTFRVFGK